MILPIKTETLIWLLPVVFMIHDFEEIIMMRPWLIKNWANLEKRFPAKAIRAMARQKDISVSAYALAVSEELVVLTVFTFLGAECEMYNFWAGFLIGFFIHLLVHIGQFITFSGYVPVIITSIPAAAYCMIALHDLNLSYPLDWKMVTVWAVVSLVIIVVNLLIALKIAQKFDVWLKKYYPEN
jgi:uncharacterized membrane protein YjjB (DUF3815 family)